MKINLAIFIASIFLLLFPKLLFAQSLVDPVTEEEINLVKSFANEICPSLSYPWCQLLTITDHLEDIKDIIENAVKIKEIAQIQRETNSGERFENCNRYNRGVQLIFYLWQTSVKSVPQLFPLIGIEASELASATLSASIFQVSMVWEVQRTVLSHGINNLKGGLQLYDFAIYETNILFEDVSNGGFDIAEQALINDFELHAWPHQANAGNVSYPGVDTHSVYEWQHGSASIRYSRIITFNGMIDNVAQFVFSLYFYNSSSSDLNDSVFIALVDDNGNIITGLKERLPIWQFTAKSFGNDANFQKISLPFYIPMIEMAKFSNNGRVKIDFGYNGIEDNSVSLALPKIQSNMVGLTIHATKGRQASVTFNISCGGSKNAGDIRSYPFNVRKNNSLLADSWFAQSSPLKDLKLGETRWVTIFINVPSDAETGSYQGEYIAEASGGGILFLPTNITISQDNVEPGTITNLQAQTGGKGEIKLSWTASGDDGYLGKTTSYTLKYSTNFLNESTWNSAIEVSAPPTPQSAGSSESFSISNLTPAQLYYIGIKAKDAAGNFSSLSNITSANAGINPAEDTVHVIIPTGGDSSSYTLKFDCVDLNQVSYFTLGYDNDTNSSTYHNIVQWQTQSATVCSYSWDVGSVPEGNYYILSIISKPASPQAIVKYSQTKITISHGNDSSYEPNDDIEHAWGPIVSGENIYSMLSIVNDRDYFYFWPGSNTHISGLLFIPVGSQYDASIMNTGTTINNTSTYHNNGNYVDFSADVVNNVSGPVYVGISPILPFGPTSQYRIIVNCTSRVFQPSCYAIVNITSPTHWQKTLPFTIDIHSLNNDAVKFDIQYRDDLDNDWHFLYTRLDPISAQRKPFLFALDGHNYHFRARGIDPIGGEGPFTESPFGVVTIDLTPPTSAVDPLKEFQTQPNFPVSWKGSDATSGIMSYKVQYRKNDGGWVDWIISTSDTVRTFGISVDASMKYNDKYDFRSIAADSAGWAETDVPQGGDASTTIMADLISPHNITDLHASSGQDTGSVMLKWNAVGNDGDSGVCSFYVFKYSLYSITDSNWDMAKFIPNSPTPVPPGQPQNLIVQGLTQGEHLYFAVRVVDDAGNISITSNSADTIVTTKDTIPPSIILGPRVFNNDYHSAILFWATNELSRGDVEYGSDTSYGYSVFDSVLSTGHNAVLNGLDSGRIYHFKIQIIDRWGNNKVTKDSIFFLITSINTEEVGVPDRYELYQNYPNPFNPNTKIEFDLPKESFVILRVYNILGQEVATLVSEKLSAGRYAIQLNGSILASGIYFYRLTAADFIKTKKLLLLK